VIQANTSKIRVIQETMKMTHSCNKSNADQRHRPLEFEVGDCIFLKVSLTKGIRRFSMAGKLSRRYIGPYPITKRVGEVAYRLELR